MNRIHLTPVVKQIFIACVILFLGSILLLNTKHINLNEYLGLHYFFNSSFKPWQIVTHMFMHDNSGFTHIIFNMFGLVMFGVILENVMGSKKFIILYFLSGLGAVLIYSIANIVEIYSITGSYYIDNEIFNRFIIKNNLQQVWETIVIRDQQNLGIDDIIQSNSLAADLMKLNSIYNGSVVGASGCLYGVLAAFVLLFPNTELYVMFIPIPIKAKIVIPGFILLDLFLGIRQYNWDPVAHFAHIGGALFGLLLTLYWRKFDKNNFY